MTMQRTALVLVTLMLALATAASALDLVTADAVTSHPPQGQRPAAGTCPNCTDQHAGLAVGSGSISGKLDADTAAACCEVTYDT